MRKFVYACLLAVFFGMLPASVMAQVEINSTNFPDSVFRKYVTTFDTDKDSFLSQSECDAVTEIESYYYMLTFVQYRNFSDLTGIEYFQNLRRLCLAKCPQLTKLDLTKNPNLTILDFHGPKPELDELTGLKELYCSGTSLNNLSLTPTIEILDCSNTPIGSLGSIPSTIVKLDCSHTGIWNIDLSSLPNLIELDCSYTGISYLFGTAAKLEKLNCSNTSISSISLNISTLKELKCSNTLIESLNLSNATGLISLECASDALKTLRIDNTGLNHFDLSTVPNLEILSVQSTSISDLNLLAVPKLKELNCSSSGVGELDLSVYPDLVVLECAQNGLSRLDVSGNTKLTKLQCSQNQISILDISKNILLTELDCSQNSIRNLEFTGLSSLNMLYCDYNQLDSIDLSSNPSVRKLTCSGETLRYLDVSGTSLTELDVTQIPSLEYLNIGGTKISDLDVSRCGSLKVVDCSRVPLNGLDLSGNLEMEYLDCSNTGITALDLSQHSHLEYVDCSSTGISSLEVSNSIGLLHLDCGNIPALPALDVSKNVALETLRYPGTGVTSVDLSSNTRLKELDCSNTGTFHLGLSNNTLLEKLDCSQTLIFNLDLSKNTLLEYLDASQTEILKLDLSNNTRLVHLDCAMESLQELNISHTRLKKLELPEQTPSLLRLVCASDSLRYLDISDLGVSQLDLTNTPNIDTLYCGGTGIGELDLSQNTNLSLLDCSGTDINDLDDLSDKEFLTHLNCSGTAIDSLDLTRNSRLQYLDCSQTSVSDLDLSQNTALVHLDCSSTGLTQLDLSQNTALQSLDCSGNRISSLDLGNSPDLTTLNCSNNRLSHLDLSKNTQVTDLLCENNSREVKAQVGGSFDLKRLSGFDVDRTFSWQGGTVDGNILTFNAPEVTYKYAIKPSDASSYKFFRLVADPHWAEPVFSVDSGSIVKLGDTIRITCSTEGSVIYYGLGEDAEPDQEYKSAEGIIITADTTYITALSLIPGHDTSAMVSATYFRRLVVEPEFSVETGSIVKKGDTIRLSCASEGSVIYYGLGEESEPDQEYKPAEGIIITADTTHIRALAMIPGHDTSEVVSATYFRRLVVEPELNPASGSIVKLGDTIRLSCASEGSVIYYGLGEEAEPEMEYKSAEGIIITADTTYITALSLIPGHDTSAMVSATYFRRLVVEPELNPASGSIVKLGDTIRLSCASEGSVIYYGLGEEAEPDQEYKSAEGIVITADTTHITAQSLIPGHDTSEVVSAVYYVKVEDPEPDPDTIQVVLPSGLEAGVEGDTVTLSWKSEEDYIYEVKVEGPGEQDSLTREVSSAGERTESHFTGLEKGIYRWWVRVIGVGETDTISVYVEGEEFKIGEVSSRKEELAGLRIYPNPSTGRFMVEVKESVRLDIYTATGLRVKSLDLEAGTESLELKVSGLYLMRFTAADGRSEYRRLVVR